MTRTKKNSFKKTCTALWLSMLLSTNAMAEDVTTLLDYLQDIVNAATESIANYVYEFNTHIPKTIATNLKAPTIEASTQQYTNALSFCQIYVSLPRHKDAPPMPIPPEFKVFAKKDQQQGNLDQFCKEITNQYAERSDDAGKFKRELIVRVPGTDIKTKKNTVADNRDESFNFENFMLPSLYKNDAERRNALNFIIFSGHTYEPFPATLGRWRQALEENPTHPGFTNYQMAVRSYVAAQSIPLANLYRMVADRTEQPQITALKLTDQTGAEIKSPLQYQSYLAARRINDPAWYQTMNTASANTVSREMLYILAEMQHTLFRLEKTNERLLATMSMIALTNLNATRENLQKLVPALNDVSMSGKH